MNRRQRQALLYRTVCPDWLNRFPSKILRLLIKTVAFPFIAIKNPVAFSPAKIALPYIEMPLTVRCTLRCVKCANLMQYYKHCWDMPYEDALRYIDILLDTADKIYQYGLIGGEPFLYPNLAGIVECLCTCGKVEKILILTNGTVVPKDEALLCALHNKKVSVRISDYGEKSRRLKEMTALFDEREICYKVENMVENWYDFGNLHVRGRNEEQLSRQFQMCSSTCTSYLNGRLHACPRSGHGMDLGLIPDRTGDYADLANLIDRKQRRVEVRRFLNQKYITACDYCNKGTPDFVKLPMAAEQQ